MQLLSDLNYSFNIISLSETWINKYNEPICNFDLPGYSFYSQPSTQRAGGVGLFIKNDMKFSVRHDLTSCSDESEVLWIEIESDLDSNLLCGVVYRHPSSNLENFLNKFYSVIGKINEENKLCLVSGDFNINLLNYDNHPLTEDFINTLNSFFLEPHILKPTRITNHSSTLIDNIFFNSIEYQTVSGNLLYDLTDHLPNFLIIDKIAYSTYKEKIYKRDYSNYNEEAFLDEFSSFNWSNLFYGISDISEMFDKFYHKVTTIVNSHIPLRQLSRRESKFHTKPWITLGLRASIKYKNRLYKYYLKTRTCYSLNKFKCYRNKLNHLLKLSKTNYYKEYFTNNKGRTKEIWKGIKQLICLKSKGSNSPNKLIIDGHEIKNDKAIADELNKFFSNIGKNLASTIPKPNLPYNYYLDKPQASSFFLSPVSLTEIENIIMSLNLTKTCGPFSIPTSILKILKSVLAIPLQLLFNYSFYSGTVPDQYKVARVVPIHKKGSTCLVSNYRPISLLSIFNKLIEKLMYNRIISFLEKFSILYNNQFGFRSKHSTSQALLLLTDKIQRSIDKGMFCSGIFLDLCKAFDTVNHKILLTKLEYYGIRGVSNDWFASYLSNRRQFVSLNGINSDYQTITCGVPQGSVLGPLLFLLYINDMPKCSNILEFHLFADDTNLFLNNPNIINLETDLNTELEKVSQWLYANKLSLNIDKTSFVVFHSPQRRILHNMNLRISNTSIKSDTCVKYLGLILDSNLNWKAYIHELSKKISRGIGVLSKLRYYVKKNILKQLYYSLIYPYLTYGLLLWGNTYSSSI